MSKIIINAITHRNACIDALGDDDAKAYDSGINDYFAKLEKLATEEGFGFEVDSHGQGAVSYRVVDETDEKDYNSAHEFMQTTPDFWSSY